MAEVEHLLVARRQGCPAAGAEHPVGVGAGEVGVQVDHLRLDPQPELHAEPAHGVDQRVQAVRPDVLVDVPVAQPGGVVATVAEPAVVEDVPLDADLRAQPASSVSRSRSWSKYTASQVFITTGRGRRGWCGRARRWVWKRAATPSRPMPCAAYTHGPV